MDRKENHEKQVAEKVKLLEVFMIKLLKILQAVSVCYDVLFVEIIW